MKKQLIIFISALIILLLSCNNDIEDNVNNEESNLKKDSINTDSLLKLEMEKKYDIFPEIKYKQVYIEDSEQLKNIKNEYKYDENNPSKNKIFLTLNRKEMRFMRVKDTLVIPDSIVEDIRAYSIFPEYYHSGKDLPKLVLVSAKYQCYAAYENGVLVRFAAANTGKEKTQTYPGRYALTWKDRLRRSSLDSNWILPFTWNFHRYAGSAFHQFEMPGYAASHSCIRQFMSDAKWLYNWGNGVKKDTSGDQIWLSGTPVIIIDAFDFSRPKTGPWVALISNKFKLNNLPINPMEVEEALIPISQIPEATRGWLPQVERYKFAEDTLKARGVIRDHVKITPSVNFNKLRRQKAAKKAAEEAKRLEEQKLQDTEQSEIKDENPPEVINNLYCN